MSKKQKTRRYKVGDMKMVKFRLNEKNFMKYDKRVKENISNICNESEGKYTDPDKRIEEIFNIGKEQIRFSPDGICGINYLKKYYKNQDCQNFKDAYSIIRNKIIIWPKHQQSINQRRYLCFKDRMDFTIFDIDNFYKNGESKLVKKDSKSALYLEKLGGIEDFIKEYELEKFVNKDNRVFNLAYSDDTVINGYEDYVFSPEINGKYLDGLIKKLK